MNYRCYHTVLLLVNWYFSPQKSTHILTLNLTIMQCCEDLLKAMETKGNWLNPSLETVNSVRPGVTVCTNMVYSGTHAVATLSPVPVPFGM